jgi:aspartate carbamoyltransferase regulatory subunit
MDSVDDLERTTKYLEHHFKMLSEQSQNFKCNLCGQLFQTEQTVNEHIRRHHGTKKP